MKEFKFKIAGNEYSVQINSISGNDLNLNVNGETFDVKLEEKESKTPTLAIPKTSASKVPAVKRTASPKATAAGGAIVAPLPGTVLSVKVKEGDTVNVGDPVMVIEAMKMQNEIQSNASGVISQIHVKEGESALEGDPLITITAG